MAQVKVRKAKITELVQDDRNLNKGTERGKELIQKSIGQFGAVRGVAVDKDNRIIAGNKTVENAIEQGVEEIIIVETSGKELVVTKRVDTSLDTKEGREMALADNATVKVDLAWDTEELNAVSEDFGLDLDAFGFDIQEMETGAMPTLADTLKEGIKKRLPWGSAKDFKEPLCDLSDHLQLHKRDCFYYVCSYHNTPTGIPLSEVKAEPNVPLFATKAEEIVRGVVQLRETEDWCVIAAPKRRNKEKNFASMVAAQLAQSLGIPFYDDVVEAHGRDRLNTDFKQVKDIPESNIILYDDILTTGQTIRGCVHLLTGKNVVCVIGIDNNNHIKR